MDHPVDQTLAPDTGKVRLGMPPSPDRNHRPDARLEVICGPMFAGKSTELIRRLREASASGACVAAFKPSQDTRYAEEKIVSHARESWKAIPVRSAEEIPQRAAGCDVVGIDEAHFFGAALAGVSGALLAAGTRVIVAGLERDHHGGPFEPFPALLCDADEVLKLSGPCARCGRPAIHSQRMVPTPGRIVVGGAGMYEPRCRACFEPALTP